MPSCNKSVTTHIYLTRKDGSGGKLFSPDVFALPNVKLDRKSNTATVAGELYDLSNIQEVKEGQYNSFLTKLELEQKLEENKAQTTAELSRVKEELRATLDLTDVIDSKTNEAKASINIELNRQIKELRQQTTAELSRVKEELRATLDLTDVIDSKINEAKASINIELNRQIKELRQQTNANSGFIVGEYKMMAKWSREVERHKGFWLKCDGSLYSKCEFPELAAIVGDSFGVGGTASSGEVFYRLPDFRGRFLLGIGDGFSLGQKGGEKTHLLTANEMPEHTHAINDPGHRHFTHPGVIGALHGNGRNPNAFGWRSHSMRNAETMGGNNSDLWDLVANVRSGPDQTNITIQNAGGNTPHNNMPPYFVFGNVYIYAGQKRANTQEVNDCIAKLKASQPATGATIPAPPPPQQPQTPDSAPHTSSQKVALNPAFGQNEVRYSGPDPLTSLAGRTYGSYQGGGARDELNPEPNYRDQIRKPIQLENPPDFN